MMANILILKYSEINQIIKEMRAEQQEITNTHSKTKELAERTTNESWKGDAAVKFQSEMNDLYLVKLRRVAEVLGKMADVAQKVSTHVTQADQSTKAFFKFD
jgi:WXG100 family type VII secretion target